MPDYKHIYYDAFPTAVKWGYGDVSRPMEVRRNLGDECKDFTWFLQNVFPDMFVPLLVDDPRNNALVVPSKANPRVDYAQRSGADACVRRRACVRAAAGCGVCWSCCWCHWCWCRWC
jgi:hypothetical protein